MKRAVRCLSVFIALSFVTACAESAADPVDSVAEPATAGADVTASGSEVTTTSAVGDFGSRYNGSPVAFWFWAPY